MSNSCMHECFPKHLRIWTARLKYDKYTEEEEGEKSKYEKYRGHENKSLDDLTVSRAYRPTGGASPRIIRKVTYNEPTLHL